MQSRCLRFYLYLLRSLLPILNSVKVRGSAERFLRLSTIGKGPVPVPGFLLKLKAMILAEISHIQGFMQLLMKSRNGKPWSPEDKSAILFHLRHLARSLPVLAVFSLPGGSLLLPFLAWFLDRRQNRNSHSPNPSAITVNPSAKPTERSPEPRTDQPFSGQ
jgi:hypothetical protein